MTNSRKFVFLVYLVSILLIYFFENISFMFDFINDAISLKIIQVIVIMIALLGILRIIKTGKILLNRPLAIITISYLLFAFIDLLILGYSYDILISLYYLIFFLANYEIYSSLKINQFMKIILIIFLISFFGGILSYYNITDFSFLNPSPYLNNIQDQIIGTDINIIRFGGFFGSPNEISILASIILIYFYNRRYKLLNFILLSTIIISNSANAIISIILALFIGFLLIKMITVNEKFAKLFGFIVIFIIFIIPMVVGILNLHLIQKYGEVLITGKIFNFRNYLWDIYFNGLLAEPTKLLFGVGAHQELNFFKSIVSFNPYKYKYAIQMLHDFKGQTQNSIITHLVTNGLIFVSLYFMFTNKILDILINKIVNKKIETKFIYLFFLMQLIQTGEGYTIFYQSGFLTIIYMFFINEIFFSDRFLSQDEEQKNETNNLYN